MTTSPGAAASGHFAERKVHPVSSHPALLGTRKPLPCRRPRTASASQATVTTETLECGIDPSSAAAAGASSTSRLADT